MSNYFICVGGTGSRIGEAFVYLAATGYLGNGDTQIWIVDKDTKCANGSILHTAVNEYEAVREHCMWKKSACFNHELSLNEWNFDDALKALDPGTTGNSPFKALGAASRETNIMMNFLHDAESMDNSMSKGFYGRAQTGTALYKAIEQIPEFFSHDALFASIQRDISAGKEPTVFLAGSSFGATGASLLPNMAKTLRKEFGSKVAIGGVLMLPYFSYETTTNDGSKALVSPETHWEKAREALRYYGDPNRMSIRKIGDPLRADHNGATFDAFYVAGCIPLRPINRTYADGGEDQNNNSHIAELYAAMSAKHFFDLTQTGNEESSDSGVPAAYSYCLSNAESDFGWGRIDPTLKLPMLSLARLSLAVLTYLHPLTHQKGALKKDDTLQKCFGKTGFLGGDARIDESKMRENVNFAVSFSKRFLDYAQWITQIGPDVYLFDPEFLSDVFSTLYSYSPNREPRLRDLSLADDYTDDMRRNVNRACQLNRIRERTRASVSPAVKETNIGQITDQIIGGMKNFRTANVSPNNYAAHTEDGMKQIYQSIYELGHTLRTI